MKQFNNYALAILALAVIGLYVMHFNCNKGECNAPEKKNSEALAQDSSATEASAIQIAYVDADSLLLQYEYAKELNEALLKKQEKSRNDIMRKQQQLQQDAIEFQKKYETGGFLTKESFEQAQKALMQKEQELQQLDGKLTQDLILEQQKLNTQLKDTISAFFKEFNADKKYSVIFSNTSNDNILYAEDYLNITKEVVEKLNERYSKKKEGAK